jgi:hypothetical protein
MVQRIDRGSLKPATRDNAGFLRADALVTRTGVFTYERFDGTKFREYRPPSEVFKPESLATFDRVPVTDDHPPVFVNSTNATAYTKGTTGEHATVFDNKYIACALVVYDQALIDKLDQGKREVSVGYECDVDLTPGISPEGESYDAVQRNISINHVAIVDRGRAGETVKVRMDGVAVQVCEDAANGLPAQTRADESEKEMVMEELKKALGDLALATARADSAEAKIAILTAEKAKLEGERDSLQVAATTAEKARKDAADGFQAMVRGRVALETAVAGIVEGDIGKMSDRDIKVAALKKLDGADIPADKSDDYVDGRFEASMERADAAAKSVGATRAAVVTNPTNHASKEDQARAEMIAANKARFDAAKAPAATIVKA